MKTFPTFKFLLPLLLCAGLISCDTSKVNDKENESTVSTTPDKKVEDAKTYTRSYVSENGNTREVIHMVFSENKRDIISGEYWLEGTTAKVPIKFSDMEWDEVDGVESLLGVGECASWDEPVMMHFNKDLTSIVWLTGQEKKTFK